MAATLAIAGMLSLNRSMGSAVPGRRTRSDRRQFFGGDKAMPCESTGYIVQSGSSWKEQSSAEVKAQKKSAESHAEREVFTGFGNKSGPYLIVQDAFPCFDGCHQHFLNVSKSKPGKKKEESVPGSSVIIKVIADNTFDMSSYVQQGLVAKIGCFPWYIYYQNGKATFRMGVPGAPEGFPVHPSPKDV